MELRACTADDRTDFLDLALDPRVTARIGDGTPWTSATADARFRRGMASCERGAGMWFLARDPAGLIGVLVAELDPDTPSEIEIGVWIAPARWGLGHARELVTAALPLVRTGFPGVTPVAYANADHGASARMLLAAGFAADGTRTGRYGTTVTRFVAP